MRWMAACLALWASGCGEEGVPGTVAKCASPGQSGGVDTFEGTALGAHWRAAAAGDTPSLRVNGSCLRIHDAAFAPTPSDPEKSWIYDPDIDLGNQMAWAQPIGTGDFELAFDFGWTSSLPEITLAGVGLAGPDHHVEMWAGVRDGDATQLGVPIATVRLPGVDAGWVGPEAEAGGGRFVIRRRMGVVTITHEGGIALIASSAAQITDVVVLTVRHKEGPASFNFGSFVVNEIAACY